MALTYDAPSTDFEDAALIGTSTLQYPQAGNDVASVIKKGYTYVQNRDDFSKLALNTESPDHSWLFLVEETVPSDAGAGLVSWTRWFGAVPSSYSTYNYEAVTFPGYYDSYDTDTNFRPPYTEVVPVEEHHEFLKTEDPVTDFVMYAYQQKELLMNARGEYVDYVNDETTVQPVGGSQTYAEYVALVAAGTPIYIRDPIGRRLYGVGNIWERVSYRTPAE